VYFSKNFQKLAASTLCKGMFGEPSFYKDPWKTHMHCPI